MKTSSLLVEKMTGQNSFSPAQRITQDRTPLGRCHNWGFLDALKINTPDEAGTVYLLDTEVQMPGEIDLACKNFLVNAKCVVIKKRRKPVRNINIYF